MVRRQLIALDGKKQGEYAFDYYLDNIYKQGDECLIFHCSDFVLNVGLPGAAVNVDHVSKKVQDALQRAEAITSAATEKLKARGVKGYVVLKSGMKPEEGILQTAQAEQVTHIIMGTRDLNSLQRALAGSVSTAVVSNAHVPVTIVKMPH